MKRFILVAIVTVMLIVALAVPASADTYHYDGTFYHLIFAGATFCVYGTTSISSGYQYQINTPNNTGVKYAWGVGYTTDYTSKTKYNVGSVSLSFPAINVASCAFRMTNVYWEGDHSGDNRVRAYGNINGNMYYW